MNLLKKKSLGKVRSFKPTAIARVVLQVKSGMVWYGMVWYGAVWYDTAKRES